MTQLAAGDGDRAPLRYSTDDAAAARALLMAVGQHEKRWPADDLRQLLERDSTLIAVFDGARAVGAAQVLWQRPYPVERLFPGCIPDDGRAPCEVSLIAVDRAYRRSAGDGGAAVLDALVKALYHLGRQKQRTHIFVLFEEWTISLFRDLLCFDLTKISGGAHYWCGTAEHGDGCRLTYACVMGFDGCARRWQAERPEFWRYVEAG